MGKKVYTDFMNKSVEKRLELFAGALEEGVPIAEALVRLGEERSSYLIKAVGEGELKANTVLGCPLAEQYCGCENWPH